MHSDLEQLISKMEHKRRRNNINWMDVLRLAVKYAPEAEVRRILLDIEKLDYEITSIWQEMVNELYSDKEDVGC